LRSSGAPEGEAGSDARLQALDESWTLRATPVAPGAGTFLRADSYVDVATQIEGLDADPGARAAGYSGRRKAGLPWRDVNFVACVAPSVPDAAASRGMSLAWLSPPAGCERT
jgi:hypothetical protein